MHSPNTDPSSSNDESKSRVPVPENTQCLMNSTLKSAESSNAKFLRRMTTNTTFTEAGNDKTKVTGKETVRLPGENLERVDSKIKREESLSNPAADKSERKKPGKAIAVAESSDNSKIKKAKNELRQTKLFKDLELLEANIAEARLMIEERHKTEEQRNEEISGSSRDDNCNYSGSESVRATARLSYAGPSWREVAGYCSSPLVAGFKWTKATAGRSRAKRHEEELC
ncbi:hypothetical protein Droror1_Dr00012492 [Drosera rotundifolia]